MLPARMLGMLLGCILCTRVLAAGDTLVSQPETEATPSFIDPLAPLFDPGQWTVVQAGHVRFGADHPAWVQLLKSIAPTGEDGVERPLYSVNLIVVENGRLLYAFAPLTVPVFDHRRMDHVFYMDDRGVSAGGPLELRDVTGDQVPEIVFHAGWPATSDSRTNIHVLQYTDQGPTKFRDIRADDFFESWWWKFRWLDLDGRTLAIVAVPAERPDEPCHQCPKFHSYRVYRWDQNKGSFLLSETIPSTGKLHGDVEDPFETDWDYIVAKLKDR